MTSKHIDYKLLGDEEDERTCCSASASQKFSSNTLTNKILILLLILSSLGHLLWPVIWTLNVQYGPTKTCDLEKTPYAGLTYDVPTPFHDVSTFVHHNSIVADATWDSWVIEPGFVALPHKFVNGKMLPEAQSSPLDSEKGVYILSSYHSLHCLHHLRKTYASMASGNPLPDDGGLSLDHSSHCFDFIRRDIMCHADDTPRYTGFSKGEKLGMMQMRMCRSWDKMEAWARSHTACFRDTSQDIEGFPIMNWTTNCPNGYVYSSDGKPISPWVTGTGVSHVGE